MLVYYWTNQILMGSPIIMSEPLQSLPHLQQ